MSRMSSSISRQNTTIWGSPLTTKSTRRSPRCRIYSTCGSLTKTRRLRNNTNDSYIGPPHQRIILPLLDLRIMRCNHNRLYLPSPNRSQIANCLLLSKPHRPCSRRHPNPNTLRICRSLNPYNRPRTNILRPILPS